MCGMEKGSGVEGSWSTALWSSNLARVWWHVIWLGRPENTGSVVDQTSFALNAIKSFQILHLSVHKVEVLEGSMEGKYFVITYTVPVGNWEKLPHALIDCGARGISFMDEVITPKNQIPLLKLKSKRQVWVIDGRPIQFGDFTSIAKVWIIIHDRKEQLPIFIKTFRHIPIVLGIPWLWFHSVVVWFASNSVTFRSQCCIAHCHDIPPTVQVIMEEPPEPVYSLDEKILEPQIWPQRPFGGKFAQLNDSFFCWTVKDGKLKISKVSVYDSIQSIEAKDQRQRPLDEIVSK